MADTADQNAYSVILSLKIHLNLVNYCLICGTSLKEEIASNSNSLVTPLNHILSSTCFVKTNGSPGVKEIQLFQDGNENTTEVNFADKNKAEKDNQDNRHVLMADADEKESWSDDEEDWGDPFDDSFQSQEEEQKKNKFMKDFAQTRFNCDKCEAFFPSSDCLQWHDDLAHKTTVGYHCSICSMDFLSLEVRMAMLCTLEACWFNHF